MEKINVLVIAGLSDKKLISKIEPIWQNNQVGKLYLVRREPLGIAHPKVLCYSSPRILSRHVVLAELWRILKIFWLVPSKKIGLIIGIHYLMHCVYAAMAGLLFGVKYIFLIVENPKLYDKSSWFRFFARRSFRIGVRGTRSEEYMVQKGLVPEKIFIPPNLFDFDKVSPSHSTKKYDLLFIGLLCPDKRVDILLKVIALLKQRKPDVKLLLAGEGELKNDLLKLSQELNLSENVEFIGHQSDIASFINLSKALILTSATEGMPMVMLEAMACGIPCIVPDVGDIRDVALNGYNSLVLEPLNIEAFSEAAYSLLTDESLYQHLCVNALKIRDEKRFEYSPQNLNEIWEDILRKSIS